MNEATPSSALARDFSLLTDPQSRLNQAWRIWALFEAIERVARDVEKKEGTLELIAQLADMGRAQAEAMASNE